MPQAEVCGQTWQGELPEQGSPLDSGVNGEISGIHFPVIKAEQALPELGSGGLFALIELVSIMGKSYCRAGKKAS